MGHWSAVSNYYLEAGGTSHFLPGHAANRKVVRESNETDEQRERGRNQSWREGFLGPLQHHKLLFLRFSHFIALKFNDIVHYPTNKFSFWLRVV